MIRKVKVIRLGEVNVQPIVRIFMLIFQIIMIVEAMPSKIILMMPKNQESSKFQRIKSQASFKNQDQDSRFNNNQDQDSRFKIQVNNQDSRFKNQEKT